jgi:hypothetical protein
MFGSEFPEAPEIESAYRTAYRTLEGVARRAIDRKQDLVISEVIEQFGRVAREAELAVAAQPGRWSTGMRHHRP